MKNPEIEFVEAIREYHRIMICIKGSPDPDALAASFVIKLLCEKYGKKARIVVTKKLSLAQNVLFARLLIIPFEFEDDFARLLHWADSYIVLDHSSPEVGKISEKLPCIVHIDHHAPVDVALNVHMQWRSKDVGSTSTMVSRILKKSYMDLPISDQEMERMTTALLFGIQTDTDKYALATKIDYGAIQFLSRFCNGKILRKLNGVPLSKTTATHLQAAQKNKIIYKDWLITGIGFVPEKNRDDIAIIADFLLRREKVALVVVFALFQNDRKKRLTLDASVRCSDPNMRLNYLIRRIAKDGGARKSKGAYQVNLDYFSTFSERERVWKFVEKTTVEKLKKAKDSNYKDRLQEVFETTKDSLTKLLANFKRP